MLGCFYDRVIVIEKIRSEWKRNYTSRKRCIEFDRKRNTESQMGKTREMAFMKTERIS